MTTWTEVFERGREVARELKEKGRLTVHYDSASGRAIDAWYLCDLGTTRDETEYTGDTDYTDVYANHLLVLGSDGVIYQFTLLNTEKGRRESGGFRVTTDKRPRATRLDPQSVHPVRCERFECAGIMASLDSLAEREEPEPPAPKTGKSESFSKYARSEADHAHSGHSDGGPAQIWPPRNGEPEPSYKGFISPLVAIGILLLLAAVLFIVAQIV